MSTQAILKTARKRQVSTMLFIREMEYDDLSTLVALISENYGEDEETTLLAAKEIVSARGGMKPQPVYFVAVIDKEIIGVIGICDSFMDTRVYEIFWVNVRKEWQGCGIGKKLITRALEHAVKQKSPMVLLTAKQDVMEFYRGLGFVIIEPVDREESQDYLMKARPDWALKMLQGRLGKESS